MAGFNARLGLVATLGWFGGGRNRGRGRKEKLKAEKLKADIGRGGHFEIRKFGDFWGRSALCVGAQTLLGAFLRWKRSFAGAGRLSWQCRLTRESGLASEGGVRPPHSTWVALGRIDAVVLAQRLTRLGGTAG